MVIVKPSMADTTYADSYRNINFREHPDRYVIGRGEQGVLIAQPYKDEILPHWRFATPDDARASSAKIYDMFVAYGREGDFVGMDMARKFLQMGFTRSRRYANHASGNKYGSDGTAKPQDAGSEQSSKAESAAIFKAVYDTARTDATYLRLKQQHRVKQRA